MGKRAKKKVQTTPGKLGVAGSRISASSPSASVSTSSLVGENGGHVGGENYNLVVGAGCLHGANVDKLRAQLAKSSAIGCLVCARNKLRSVPPGGKDRRCKGKPMKKKVHNPSAVSPSPDEKSSSHKFWICLSCGHVGCGGGNSASGGTPGNEKLAAKPGVVGRGHAWQHYSQLKHPIVMQCGDEFSCWCFHCEVASELKIDELKPHEPVEGEEKTSEPFSKMQLLQQSAKLVQVKLAEQAKQEAEAKEAAVDTLEEEDGKSQSAVSTENAVSEEGEAGKPRRIIKGLINLGNTCFFNSVMQNLLGVEVLRDYFLVDSTTFEGPLTTSLRKFYQEISVYPPGESSGSYGHEGGLKRTAKARGGWSGTDGVHNPKGLFGAICSKVPRFKGYQQQDSHELLKCLLDGLHTEEETAWKLASSGSSKVSESGNGKDVRVDDLDQASAPPVKENGPAEPEKKQPPSETFVDRVFGGQLSSTVSCCECGHSSVVYEPFLDLSLPITSMKLSKKELAVQSESDQSTNGVLSKSQRVASFKTKGSHLTLKTTGRGDLEDDVLTSSSSQIAGLGTPLLLLPPPPQDSSVENLILSTGSGEANWLDFLDGDEDTEFQVFSGCAPNPEAQMSIGCASDPNLQIVSGCPEDASLTKRAISADEDTSLNCLTYEQFDDRSGVDELPSAADYNSTLQPGELLLLEAPRHSWSETHMISSWYETEKSTFNSSAGPEDDGYVQIRGGSDSHVLLLTQGNESDFFCPELIADDSNNSGTSAEQSVRCNDDSKLCSENGRGPSETGPPIHGNELGCPNVEAQGDFDGVASLFEEEDNGNYAVHGPFPSNHDGGGLEASTGYEEVGLDDVLDLGKISSEGREDWVESKNAREEDSDDVTMTLEGCLQIFTRPEILSGENAWGCENCTNKYHENLAAASAIVTPSVLLPQKHSARRMSDRSSLENCYTFGDVNGLDRPEGEKFIKDALSEGNSSDDLRPSDVDKDACSGLPSTSNSKSDEGTMGNRTKTGVVTVKVYPTETLESGEGPAAVLSLESLHSLACDDGKCLLPAGVGEQSLDVVQDAALGKTPQTECPSGGGSTIERRESLLMQSASKPVELLDAGDMNTSRGTTSNVEDCRDVIEEQSSVRRSSTEGDGYGTNKTETEPGVGELRKEVILLGAPKSLKLTKSRSRRVVVEPRKIIKQEATKRYLISKAPPVLVVQLKRFARDMRGRLSKLYGKVAFQEWLDLQPYVDNRHVTPQNCRYRLTGTVEHTGTLKGGHYVAYVRGPPAPHAAGSLPGESLWYHISDSHVRQATLDSVLKTEAYLLFYERC